MIHSRTRVIGILTSGGDCPGLNAAIRGVVKPAISDFHIEVIGIEKGFRGLVENHSRVLHLQDVSNILTVGGTLYAQLLSGTVMTRFVKDAPGPAVPPSNTMFAPTSKSLAVVVVTAPLLLTVLFPWAAAVTSTGLVTSTPRYSAMRISGACAG